MFPNKFNRVMFVACGWGMWKGVEGVVCVWKSVKAPTATQTDTVRPDGTVSVNETVCVYMTEWRRGY